jgi:alkylmercury lyase
LALFRLLGQGEPVTCESLAERAGVPLDQVAAFIDASPTLQRERQGSIIAFGGLTLLPTSHVLEVDGRALHAWCALETLFLPELLARPARVRSTCPATGQPVTLTVDIDGVHDLAPAGAVMTLHTVDGLDPNDVVGTFCCFVHFFVTEHAARDWATPNPGHLHRVDHRRLRRRPRLQPRTLWRSPDHHQHDMTGRH